MASIDGKEVKEGTILSHNRQIARVERLTKTQAVCVQLTKDLELTKWTFRVKLDTVDKWGPRKNGGLEIGTGSGWHSKWWRVLEDVDAFLAEQEAADAEAKAKGDERARKEAERVASQFQMIGDAYENRACLDADLGVWTITFQHPVLGPVVTVWTAEHRKGFNYRTVEETDEVHVRVTWFARDRDRIERVSTDATAGDEQTALASVWYYR